MSDAPSPTSVAVCLGFLVPREGGLARGEGWDEPAGQESQASQQRQPPRARAVPPMQGEPSPLGEQPVQTRRLEGVVTGGGKQDCFRAVTCEVNGGGDAI